MGPGLSPQYGGRQTRLPGWGGFSVIEVVDDPIFVDPNEWLSQRGSMTQQQNSGDYEPDSLEKHLDSLRAKILQK